MPECLDVAVTYIGVVPKLWNKTMSQIAEETGIGRATLYKYFSDVEAILFAWQQRQITGHLEYLAEVRDQAGDRASR